jgi:hypothetical protein
VSLFVFLWQERGFLLGFCVFKEVLTISGTGNRDFASTGVRWTKSYNITHHHIFQTHTNDTFLSRWT